MVLRNRQKRDKESLVKMSSNVTDQLLSISRQLADTTQRSANTLETLVTSSDSVTGTQDELKVTSGAINQSGKMLAKYGRREFTDKILIGRSHLCKKQPFAMELSLKSKLERTVRRRCAYIGKPLTHKEDKQKKLIPRLLDSMDDDLNIRIFVQEANINQIAAFILGACVRF
ncbi:hypothetical protein NQ317_013028 [Molorchus minor]|uniref:Sec20 C-terminal domain-containing protein n=1 Tax=Molorchus minor TaxID=1323400 RepID=A0ABQ9K3B6_9CUCU|nr:hypothetical protein NQ317_013028 [Molorchus minor]